MSDNDGPGKLTTLDTAELKEWLAQCDPQTPLELGDERYLDLGHALDDERIQLRGKYSVDRLLDPIGFNAVERRGTLEDIDEEDHAKLASFMQDYLVLCYLNGDDRYEIHPLIRETVQQRLAQLAADPPK